MSSKATSLGRARWIGSRLGSLSFLEPKSLLVLVVPLTITTSIVTASASSPSEYFLWLLANVIALALLAIPVVVIRPFWQNRAPELVLHPAVALLVAALFSYSKTWLVIELAAHFMPAITLDWLGRLLGGTVSGTVAILAASASLLLLQEFQAERSLLLMAKAMSAVPVLTAAEAAKLATLASRILSVTQEINSSKDLPIFELKILRELVDQYVRPLSSSLYSDLESSYQNFSIRELLSSASHESPPAIPLGLLYLLSVPQNVQWFGLEAGITLGFLGATAISAGIVLISKVFAKLGLTGFLAYMIQGVLVPLAAVLCLVGMLSPGHSLLIPASLAILFWYGQSSLIFGMARIALRSARDNREEVLRISRNDDAELAFALLRRNRRMMANQMHGEVQSRLMNLILRAEARDQLERQAVVEELLKVADLLRSVRVKGNSLSESLAELTSTWAGFVKIASNTNGLGEQYFSEHLIAALIEESVSNAVRHGLATEVSISFPKADTMLVEDNGMGPTNGRPGLGTKLLDASSKSWSLTPREQGGSRLSVNLKPT